MPGSGCPASRGTHLPGGRKGAIQFSDAWSVTHQHDIVLRDGPQSCRVAVEIVNTPGMKATEEARKYPFTGLYVRLSNLATVLPLDVGLSWPQQCAA